MKLDAFEFSAYDDLREKDCHFSFGLAVSDKCIDIFVTDIDSVIDTEKHIPSICQAILEKYHPDKKLQDISWTYTAGGGISDLTFDQCNGLATTMTLSNEAVLEPYCIAYKIGVYEEALIDPRGLQAALWDGYSKEALPSFSRDPAVMYLAYTPHHETQKIHVMKAAYPRSLEDNPVVFVDSQKFISHWKKQCTPEEPESGLVNKLKFKFLDKAGLHRGFGSLDVDDRSLLSSTLETSQQHYIPNEIACGVALDFENKIRFTNGRHRTVNLANLGAPFIPVQSGKYGLDEFRELFEWKEASALSHGFDVE